MYQVRKDWCFNYPQKTNGEKCCFNKPQKTKGDNRQNNCTPPLSKLWNDAMENYPNFMENWKQLKSVLRGWLATEKK